MQTGSISAQSGVPLYWKDFAAAHASLFLVRLEMRVENLERDLPEVVN